jgi:hypothetical protein
LDISPERWQKIEQLYHTALEHEQVGRSAFLDQACQGDVDLRCEVDALLAQGDAAGDSTVTMLTPGAQLGPYQIEAPIGAGGMGSVYRAIDTRLGRKVELGLRVTLVTADGKRFLLDTVGSGSASTPVLTAVSNWDAGLKK